MAETAQIPPSLKQLRAKRDEILSLAEHYGAYNVRIFGSVARNEAGTNSDVDILVTFQDGASLFELSGLWQALEELLGYKINIISEGGLKERFRQRIEPDLVSL